MQRYRLHGGVPRINRFIGPMRPAPSMEASPVEHIYGEWAPGPPAEWAPGPPAEFIWKVPGDSSLPYKFSNFSSGPFWGPRKKLSGLPAPPAVYAHPAQPNTQRGLFGWSGALRRTSAGFVTLNPPLPATPGDGV